MTNRGASGDYAALDTDVAVTVSPDPTLTIGDASVTEGDDGAANLTFTVTLSAASTQQVTVNYAEGTGGTATAGTDYTTLTAGTLTFAAGATSQTITVAVTGDTTDEPDEPVVVTLSSPTNATLPDGGASGTGTITDDDAAPTVTVGAAAGTHAEAGDFSPSTNTTLTIAAGSTTSTGTVTVSAVDNGKDEPNKTVVVSGTATNGQGITQPADVDLTITDDDGAPTLTIGNGSVTEGDNGSVNLTFTVTLSVASGKEVTVGYTEGTATSGMDYTALTSGTLTFTTGATSQTLTVSVTGDTTDEPHETVIVTLSSPTNATLPDGGASGTGTITDDDDAPTVTLAVAPGSIAESGGTATLSHASSVATTVTVTPVSDAYTLGSDATIVIAAESTAAATDKVPITAVNDAIDNVGNRRATVAGSVANSQGIGTVTGAALTLTDDEAAPTVTLALSEPDPAKPDTINKSGPDNVSTVTATLNGASSEAVTLTVSATKGPNTQRDDFTLSNTRTLTIAAGATTSTGTVTVTAADNDDEGDKAVTVSATVTGNSGVANPTAVTLTIAEAVTRTIGNPDDTPRVTLTVTPTSIAESGGTATVNRVSFGATTVTVGATAGSNAAAGDFRLSTAKTLTIAAWSTTSTGTVTITAVGNSKDAANKTVVVTGTATNSQGITQPANVDLTITDDDGAPALSIGDASVTEGDSGSATLTFTVSLSPVSGRQVTVKYAEGVGGTATAGTDYTALPAGTLTIAAGATSQTVRVAVTGGASGTGTITDDDAALTGTVTAVNNTRDAANKTVVVTGTATNSQGITQPADVDLTITDDDAAPTVTLAVVPSAIAESGGMVTATLSHASSAATTVTVTPVSGLYTVGADATIVIAAGSTANASDTATITACRAFPTTWRSICRRRSTGPSP